MVVTSTCDSLCVDMFPCVDSTSFLHTHMGREYVLHLDGVTGWLKLRLAIDIEYGIVR